MSEENDDMIIFHFSFNPPQILQYFNSIKARLFDKVFQKKSGMYFEDVEDGELQIFENEASYARNMESLSEVIEKVLENPSTITEMPLNISDSEISIPFPDEGLSVFIKPTNEYSQNKSIKYNNKNRFEPLKEYFQVSDLDSQNGWVLFFPTLESFKIYGYLFNYRYI